MNTIFDIIEEDIKKNSKHFNNVKIINRKDSLHKLKINGFIEKSAIEKARDFQPKLIPQSEIKTYSNLKDNEIYISIKDYNEIIKLYEDAIDEESN